MTDGQKQSALHHAVVANLHNMGYRQNSYSDNKTTKFFSTTLYVQRITEKLIVVSNTIQRLLQKMPNGDYIHKIATRKYYIQY